MKKLVFLALLWMPAAHAGPWLDPTKMEQKICEGIYYEVAMVTSLKQQANAVAALLYKKGIRGIDLKPREQAFREVIAAQKIKYPKIPSFCAEIEIP